MSGQGIQKTMTKENQPHWARRYGMALVSFALAFGLTLLLSPIKEKGIFILFLAAVALSTWHGGVKPGVFTAVLSAIAGTYFFLPPNYSLLIEDFGTSLRLIEFLLVSTLIITLSGARRAAQQRAEAALAEAERANRAKDDFLAMVSHDLRTPLSAILGWTRMLRSGDCDEETRARAIGVIERSAQAQRHLIDDLLDVSRIVNGTLRLDLHPISLRELVEAAVDSLRPTAEANNVRVETKFDGGQVLGDAGRLEQVLWNLLSNAIKFTPGGGRVRVRLDNMFTYLRLTVSDNGKGIDPDFLPYIFDRFRQGERAGKFRGRGLGLGLAIVRHLIELHNGTVQVESPGHGRGAIFTVRLPLLTAQTSGEDDLGARRAKGLSFQSEA
jgi:signal transduction histidine kinase